MADLLVSVSQGIATLTLNRPARMNAFSREMILGIYRSLQEIRDDHAVRVVVITGAGDAFCAGGDLKAMKAGQGFMAGEPEVEEGSLGLRRKNELWREIQRIPLILQDFDKPVIAAVNGVAVGAGCDLAMMCDLRLASDKARFSEGYVRLGLIPGDGGAYFLPRLVGTARALELLWTGDFIEARDAERIGLVNRVVPHDELPQAVHDLALRLASGPSLAISIIKRALYQGLQTDLKTHLDAVSSHMAWLQETGDHLEGLKAMLEKRPPRFCGR